MNTHVVPIENAAKVVQGLLAVHPVVVIVASIAEGGFVLDRLFERTRVGRCDLEMRDGRPVPVQEIASDVVVQVAGPDVSFHGAVTGHARAMTATNMAEASRLILHVDPTLMSRWPGSIATIERVAIVVVS